MFGLVTSSEERYGEEHFGEELKSSVTESKYAHLDNTVLVVNVQKQRDHVNLLEKLFADIEEF